MNKEQLIKENQGLVHKTAHYWYKRRAVKSLDLNDLIQEGNLGLLEAAERYDPSKNTKFFTYAYYWVHKQIITTACPRKRASIVEFLDEIKYDQRHRSTEDFAIERAFLMSIMKQLPNNAWEIFYLHLFENFTFKEIGVCMKCSHENVRQVYIKYCKKFQKRSRV